MALSATMRNNDGRHADLLEDVRQEGAEHEHLDPIHSQVNTN